MEKELFAPIYILTCHVIPYICAKTYFWWNDDDDNSAAIAFLILGLIGMIALVAVAYLNQMFEVIGKGINKAKGQLKIKLYGQPIGWEGFSKKAIEDSLTRIKGKHFHLEAINYMKQAEDNPNKLRSQGYRHSNEDFLLTWLRHDVALMNWMIETNSMPVYKHKCFRQQPLTADKQIHDVVHAYNMLQTIYSPATALLKLVNNDYGLEIEIKAEPLPELEVTF